MMDLKSITLISHASVLIQINDLKILTDPWFLGTAFNDGWSLAPAPNLESLKSMLFDVDVVWISHEHPDHLHFPTLKYIKALLPDDVQIAFQETNSEKVFEALRKLGYQNFLRLPHMRKIKLNRNVAIAVYAHRHLDSALAIFEREKFWALDINDTELNTGDIRLITKRFGNPQILMNQFSIAGSEGILDLLEKDSKRV